MRIVFKVFTTEYIPNSHDLSNFNVIESGHRT